MYIPTCIPCQVSTNGLISFEDSESKDVGAVPSLSPSSTSASTYTLIAPFWGDADTTHSGIVSYGTTTDSATLTLAREFIRVAFPGKAAFVPSYLFVALWDSVGYSGGNGELVRASGLVGGRGLWLLGREGYRLMVLYVRMLYFEAMQ